jgi:hypothetical protein
LHSLSILNANGASGIEMDGAQLLIELDDDLLLCSVFTLLSPPELVAVAQARAMW